jgi:hypothetical protein
VCEKRGKGQDRTGWAFGERAVGDGKEMHILRSVPISPRAGSHWLLSGPLKVSASALVSSPCFQRDTEASHPLLRDRRFSNTETSPT